MADPRKAELPDPLVTARKLAADKREEVAQAAFNLDAVLFAVAAAAAAGFVNVTMEPPEPLDLRGTLFQRQVWQVLRGIPPGQTLSYAQVAERLGQPKAARAVARACAANAVALAVPCHRVVRGDGGLSGYRWGVDRKRALLLREGAQVAA